MCKKIFNWLKKQFGQTSLSVPEGQKQNIQTNTPSSTEGKNAAPTEVKSSADAIGVSTEEILKKVEIIEEYLNLGQIASEAKTIDYSFVKDSIIRGKLISDHTSMWRCRLGTRTHNPEFNEFCLYVQMQVESLLRYYYSKRFEGDENQLYDHFFHKPKDPNKDLDITYKNLLWDFNTAFGKKYNINIDVLDTIRILRNGLVHSGSDEIINLSSKFIEEVLKYAEENDITVHYFLSQKVSINTGASINFNTIINKDSNKFNEYRNIATAKKPIQKFNKSVRLKILKEQKPFDAIIIDLKKWITAIRNELANVK